MAALSVMLAAVGSLCGAIEREAVDPALYGEKSRAAVAQTHGMRDDDAVTAYIGMDAACQHDAAQTIALYMALGGEDAPLAVDELNEKEISHMSDVRRLIATMEKRHRPVMIGAVCGALVPAAAAGVVGGMMNAAGFEAVFVGLHRLIFTNSNWLLNPATDILIRMMPQALFETALRDVLGQFALAFALAVLLLAAAYAVVSGMVKRQLTQTEERP